MSSEKKPKSYPTALPHRPPESVKPEPRRVSVPADGPSETAPDHLAPRLSGTRWVGRLGIAIVLGLATGIALWQVKDSVTTSVPEADPPTAPKEDTTSTTPAPRAKPIKTEGLAHAQKKLAVLKVADPPRKPAVNIPASALPPTPASEVYLEALGSLTAAHLYQSYVTIGLLADGVESEQLTREEAETTLATTARLMTLVERQLDLVSKLDLEPSDRKVLQNVHALTQTLRKQTTALRAYWDKGETEQITAFHKARTEAWMGIQEMLGLDKTDGGINNQADANP